MKLVNISWKGIPSNVQANMLNFYSLVYIIKHSNKSTNSILEMGWCKGSCLTASRVILHYFRSILEIFHIHWFLTLSTCKVFLSIMCKGSINALLHPTYQYKRLVKDLEEFTRLGFLSTCCNFYRLLTLT